MSKVEDEVEFKEFEITERPDPRGAEYGKEYTVLALCESDKPWISEGYWHMAVCHDQDAARLVKEALEAKLLSNWGKKSLDDLSRELNAWQTSNHLPHDSADEQLFRPNLKPEQSRYLTEFCKRWEEAEKREDDEPRQNEDEDLTGEADFDEVVSHLRTDAGLTNAEVIATGGGIDCIEIPCGEYRLVFGTSGENWGFCVYKTVGDSEEFAFNDCDIDILTGVSSENPDASAVALGIAQAAMKFDERIAEFAAKWDRITG